jgi:hypothetical protein
MNNSKIDRHIAASPVSVRGIMIRALSGKASPRQAIKAKCLECAHYDRAEVSDCLVILCPLRPYRPYQKNADGEDAEEIKFEDHSNALEAAIEKELSADAQTDQVALRET